MKKNMFVNLAILVVVATLAVSMLLVSQSTNSTRITAVKSSSPSAIISIATVVPSTTSPSTTTSVFSEYNSVIKNGHTSAEATACQQIFNEMKPGSVYNAIPEYC